MDIIPEQLFTHNDYVTVSIQRVMHANWRVDIVPPPCCCPSLFSLITSRDNRQPGLAIGSYHRAKIVVCMTIGDTLDDSFEIKRNI